MLPMSGSREKGRRVACVWSNREGRVICRNKERGRAFLATSEIGGVLPMSGSREKERRVTCVSSR